jgi:hypothetical protein
MKFLLDIYTWPAMSGINPKVRSSHHETPDEASLHLEAQTEPYAYAVLQREIEQGHFEPCDWEGQPLAAIQQWPHRMGTNGDHPAVTALKNDWRNLVNLVYNQYDGTKGMIDIADKLLRERHPYIYGYASILAWEAASK